MQQLKKSASCGGYLEKKGDKGPEFMRTCMLNRELLRICVSISFVFGKTVGKRRFFLIAGPKVYYSYTENDENYINFIDLSLVSGVKVTSKAECTFRLESSERVYHLRAPDENELNDWIACLNEAKVCIFFFFCFHCFCCGLSIFYESFVLFCFCVFCVWRLAWCRCRIRH